MKGERRYSKEPGIVVCHCECGSFNYCPKPNTDPCKLAYKAMLKAMKEAKEKSK